LSISIALGPTPFLLSGEQIDANVAQIYTNAANNLSVSTGSWPSQSGIDSDISSMYSTVNETSTFQGLMDKYGTSHFLFSIAFSEASGVTNATFGASWPSLDNSTAYTNVDSWLCTVASGGVRSDVISGPTFTQTLSVTNQNLSTSNNWAGYELHTPGYNLIHHTGAVTQVATLTTPPQPPQDVPPIGAFADPVAAVWVGASPNADGMGGLLQTGYIDDTKDFALGNYDVWTEMLPWPSSGVNMPLVKPGDNLDLQVNYDTTFIYWSWWSTVDYDSTMGDGLTTFFLTWSSYAPHYTQTIIEAPTYGNIMQIPEFTSPTLNATAFYWQWGITDDSTVYSADQLFSAGDYTVYQLEQSATDPPNTNEFANEVKNGDWVTWLNSYYNYEYIYG
jgi:hypothetical protein